MINIIHKVQGSEKIVLKIPRIKENIINVINPTPVLNILIKIGETSSSTLRNIALDETNAKFAKTAIITPIIYFNKNIIAYNLNDPNKF
ncbi:MAG: hypothetical protein BAJALOKI3v1_90057 [Promethearchaeota archaeon]|nr:MAG: hypothetical protein BAJALOKI3v1_90057 [Candidatus Lokiarchaeota archaeon]